MGLPVQATLTGETMGRALQEFPQVSPYDRLAELAQKLDRFAPQVGYPQVSVNGIPGIQGCHVNLGSTAQTGTHWQIAVRPTEQSLEDSSPDIGQGLIARTNNLTLFRSNAQSDTLWSLLRRDHQGIHRELGSVDDGEGMIAKFVLRVAHMSQLDEASRKMARRKSDALRERRKHLEQRPESNGLHTDKEDRRLLAKLHAIGYTATSHFVPEHMVGVAELRAPIEMHQLPSWAILALMYENIAVHPNVATPPRAQRKRNLASKVQ